VAVGHSTDRLVLDAVADRSFITPTAFGEWLRQQLEAKRVVPDSVGLAGAEARVAGLTRELAAVRAERDQLAAAVRDRGAVHRGDRADGFSHLRAENARLADRVSDLTASLHVAKGRVAELQAERDRVIAAARHHARRADVTLAANKTLLARLAEAEEGASPVARRSDEPTLWQLLAYLVPALAVVVFMAVLVLAGAR
jgi:exonuclease VII large subunit